MKKNRRLRSFRDRILPKKHMRVSIMLLLGLVFFMPVQAQTKQPVVSLAVKEQTVVEIFKLLEKQVPYKFMYHDADILKLGRKSLNVTNVPLTVALDSCVKGSLVGYEFVGNQIVFKRVSRQAKVRMVSGTVKDVKGELMQGVAVVLKGTSTGVTTDTRGHFVLSVPVADLNPVVLHFSFLGMKDAEIRVTTDEPLLIVLEESNEKLDEVVVTGYQNVRSRDMVGSYTKVNAADIMMPAYTSIDQMLQGKIAGLMVMNTSSRVGTSPEIRIRGTSTILGNKAPLWVVDGVIQPDPIPFDRNDAMTEDLKNIVGSQISWLNPADIETITVLKDASATAIYGSKASNGVIVVTTKRGFNESRSIKYSMNLSFRRRPTYGLFNLMNSKERIRFTREVFDTGGSYDASYPPIKQLDTYEGLYRMYMDQDISRDDFASELAKLETTNTDWLDILTRNAVSHNHNLSISGGSEKITYSASVSYADNKGVELKNSQEQMSGRLNLGVKLHPKLRVDLTLIGSLDKVNGYGPSVNPMSYATSTSRAIRAYDDGGDRLFYRLPASYQYRTGITPLKYNILNEIDNTYSRSKTTRVNATIDLNWDILSWLKYQLVAGVSKDEKNGESYAGERSYYVAGKYRGYDYGAAIKGDPDYAAAVLPFGGEFFTSNTSAQNYNVQNKLLVDKTFKENHRLNVMLGLEVRSTANKSLQNKVWGYVPDRGKKVISPTLPSEFISQSPSRLEEFSVYKDLYNGAWRHTTGTDNFLSYFATLVYSYKDRYVLNASIRNDESNRFGQDVNKRFDPSYSVGLSWDVSEEELVRTHLPWLDQLRLRVSYGIQGNVVETISPDIIVAQQGVVDPFATYGVSIAGLPNPDLSWESTKTWNLGMDLQFLKWVTMCLEYYRRASDAIIYQPIPREYGVSDMALNGGRVYNHGVEFTMNITPVRTKDFGWTIGLNTSKNWNKAKRIDSGMTSVDAFLNGVGDRVLKKGYPLSAFWSFSFKGLDPENGMPQFNLMDAEAGNDIDPTTFLVYSGESEPYFTGGLNTRFRFKDFTIGGDFSLLLGAKRRLPNLFPNEEHLPSPYVNMDRDLLKRWKQPGDEERTDIPAYYSGGVDSWMNLPDGRQFSLYEMWRQSDARVVNASFLRCNQLSLTWNMNEDWCKKLGILNLSVNLMMNNAFVIASKRLNGFDPELDNSIMPKTYSLGFSVGF